MRRIRLIAAVIVFVTACLLLWALLGVAGLKLLTSPPLLK